MPPATHPPRVLVPACRRDISGRTFHAVPAAYSEALRLAGCQPLLAPGGSSEGELGALLALAHGILLPGSPNNVHPSHFGEEILDPSLPLDLERDALTLPLIRAAVSSGIPLLGICRGHQEINVALGGSLHQDVSRIPGFRSHQHPQGDPPEVVFGPAHDVHITPGGLLHHILPSATATVNSAHDQAVNHLAPGFSVEATSPDGVIEAISLPSAHGFVLGLQWHPEWHAAANPASQAIFHAFAAACLAFRDRPS